MASERVVILALDGSEYSDYAFDCEYHTLILSANEMVIILALDGIEYSYYACVWQCVFQLY